MCQERGGRSSTTYCPTSEKFLEVECCLISLTWRVSWKATLNCKMQGGEAFHFKTSLHSLILKSQFLPYVGYSALPSSYLSLISQKISLPDTWAQERLHHQCIMDRLIYGKKYIELHSTLRFILHSNPTPLNNWTVSRITRGGIANTTFC